VELIEGHAGGDVALRDVAKVIALGRRPAASDGPERDGGDGAEGKPHQDVATAQVLAEGSPDAWGRLDARHAIDASPFLTAGGHASAKRIATPRAVSVFSLGPPRRR